MRGDRGVTRYRYGCPPRGAVLVYINEKMKLGLTITPIKESISGMIKIIGNTPLEDFGKMHQYSGRLMIF